MKRVRLISAFVLVLMLSLSGVAYAAPPDPLENPEPGSIASFTVTPGTAYPGDTVTFSIEFAIASGDVASPNTFCIYYADSDYSGAPSGNVTSSLGDTYTADWDGNTDCPANGSLYEWELIVADPIDDAEWGDFMEFSFTVPSAAASDTFRLRQDNSDPAAGAWVGGSNKTLTINTAPSTVYASDLSGCGGYGVEGSSCVHELDTAEEKADAYGATELVIVGDLTVEGGEVATIDADITTIRGTNSGRLVAGSTCASQSLLTLSKNNVTVRDLDINGAACTGTAVGIEVTGGPNIVLDNLTVQNFVYGTGIEFNGSGAGTLRNSVGSIVNNYIGVDDASTGAVIIGSGPSTGNTFTNNTIGIQSDGDITIKGNTITGGMYGVSLSGNPSLDAFHGNRITGASSQQVYCNGASSGAAWNFLGGTSPDSGSNCADVTSQLGSNWVTWAEGSAVSGLTVGGTVIATFDLGANLPFQYGSTAGRTSNYYAVYDTGTADAVAVGGSGTTQYKMFVPPNTGGACPTGTEVTCWESATNSRTQDGSGYYYKGSQDPTAITLSDVTATAARSTWVPAALAAFSLVGLGGVLLVLRRRR